MLLVSGSTGFIGSHLLKSDNFTFLSWRRNGDIYSGDVLVSDEDFTENVKAVIALGGLAHGRFSHDEYQAALETLDRLLEKSRCLQVKRFIYISSCVVFDHDCGKAIFARDTKTSRIDSAATYKLKSEERVRIFCSTHSIEYVIIRSSLVYGSGVKGNFAQLIGLVKKGWPLPFGLINNRRSFIAVDNLIDLILTCVEHQDAANEVFLASDGCDLSTTELLKKIAYNMNSASKLIPVPASILYFILTILGKKYIAEKLFESFQLDISKTQKILGWAPPISVEEGLRRCLE